VDVNGIGQSVLNPVPGVRDKADMTEAPPSLRATRRSLPIALLRAREVVMGPIREMLAASGINEQKWRVLRVLHEQGPLELSQIAAEACLLLSSLTRMIGPMVDEGLVTRHTPAEDRRKTVLMITEAGVALIHRHAAESAAIFARIEADFGRDRLDQLLDLLGDLQGIDPRPR
jgi:homoprotocatechuate degradation regulator HpaR